MPCPNTASIAPRSGVSTPSARCASQASATRLASRPPELAHGPAEARALQQEDGGQRHDHQQGLHHLDAEVEAEHRQRQRGAVDTEPLERAREAEAVHEPEPGRDLRLASRENRT